MNGFVTIIAKENQNQNSKTKPQNYPNPKSPKTKTDPKPPNPKLPDTQNPKLHPKPKTQKFWVWYMAKPRVSSHSSKFQLDRINFCLTSVFRKIESLGTFEV
jgi:hypothetical protein